MKKKKDRGPLDPTIKIINIVPVYCPGMRVGAVRLYTLYHSDFWTNEENTQHLHKLRLVETSMNAMLKRKL